MPHEHCFNEEAGVLWLHVVGDIMIAAAYFSIPLILLYLVYRRPDLRYKGLFALFAAFILACGLTHALAIVSMWEPYYRLEGMMKLFTGIISLSTAGVLFAILPIALKVPGRDALEKKNRELRTLLYELESSNLHIQEVNDKLNDAQRITHLGSWSWDLGKDRLSMSDEMYRLLGLQPGALALGMDQFIERIAAEDRQRVKKAMTEGMDRGTFDITFQLTDFAGEQKHFHTRGHALYNELGQVYLINGTSLDITDRIAGEMELWEKTRKLKQHNTHLKRIAFATSHDLKEPLRGIVSYSQLVLRESTGKLAPESQEKLEYVVEEGKRMAAMVDSLLSFARTENQAPNKRQVPAAEAIRQAELNLHLYIEERRAVVNSQVDATVLADREQLVIVFQNLIGNAVKFNTSEIPQVDISVEKLHDHWRFSVQDNGIGFDEQYSDRLFNLFTKLHTIQHYSGSGIGLAICRTIIESHGGQIWASSHPGKGSTFYFTLPI